MPTAIATPPRETIPTLRSAPHRGALASLALAILLAALGTSIATVGLPVLAEAFAASFAQAQWIVLAYLLATTVVVVAAGWLGDAIGRRRALVAGLAVFTASSAVAGIAPTYGVLIAARVLQGIGAAMMMAMAMAMVGAVVAGSRIGRAMGLLGTMSAVGTALGPSLGGLLLALGGWPALFLACVPLGLGTALLAHRSLPADHGGDGRRQSGFDHPGMALLAAALAAYTLAMTVGVGASGLLVAGLLGAAGVTLGLFILRETRTPSPLLPLALFRERTLTGGFISNISATAVVMATLVIGPFYLAGGLALAAVHVGLVMTVGPLVAALMGVPAGRLVDRYGAFRIWLVGLAGMTAGCMALALVTVSQGIAGYVVPLAVTTAGFALHQAGNSTAVMTRALPERRGVVSGLLTLARNLGLVTGASVLGTLFAAGAAVGDGPSAAESGMRLAFGVCAVLVSATALLVGLRTRP